MGNTVSSKSKPIWNWLTKNWSESQVEKAVKLRRRGYELIAKNGPGDLLEAYEVFQKGIDSLKPIFDHQNPKDVYNQPAVQMKFALYMDQCQASLRSFAFLTAHDRLEDALDTAELFEMDPKYRDNYKLIAFANLTLVGILNIFG